MSLGLKEIDPIGIDLGIISIVLKKTPSCHNSKRKFTDHMDKYAACAICTLETMGRRTSHLYRKHNPALVYKVSFSISKFRAEPLPFSPPLNSISIVLSMQYFVRNLEDN